MRWGFLIAIPWVRRKALCFLILVTVCLGMMFGVSQVFADKPNTLGKVTNFSAATGGGSVLLTWDPPMIENDGSNNEEEDLSISGYEYKKQGPWVPIPNSDSATVSYLIENLALYSEHTFKIRAVDDDNNGGAGSNPTKIGVNRLENSLHSHFGSSVALSADAETLFVGAIDDESSGKGAVHVYDKNENGIWIHSTTLDTGFIDGFTLTNDDYFGSSLALSSNGDKLFIGAPGNDTGGSERGAVYIFSKNDDSWSLEETVNNDFSDLTLSDADHFGSTLTVSPDGNTLFVGASNHTSGSLNHSFFIFTDTNAEWTYENEVSVGSSGISDMNSLTFLDDTLFVSVHGETSNTIRSYTENTESVWTYNTVLDITQAPESLALSSDGNTLYVGTVGANHTTGSVMVYRIHEDTFTYVKTIEDNTAGLSLHNGDRFGSALALSADGETLFIGSPRRGSKNEGAVYEFDLSEILPPFITSAAFTSSNSNSSFAKAGDTLTLTLAFTESLASDPVVTIAGNNGEIAGSGTAYTASHIVQAGDTNEAVVYDISTLSDDDGNTFDPPAVTSSIIIDTVIPTLSDPIEIGTTEDSTPNFTFTSDEAGTITYGGACSSETVQATIGQNTVTFKSLQDEVYSDCTITVTDTAGNASTVFSIPTFIVGDPQFSITITSDDTAPEREKTIIATANRSDSTDWKYILVESSDACSSTTNFIGATPYTRGEQVIFDSERDNGYYACFSTVYNGSNFYGISDVITGIDATNPSINITSLVSNGSVYDSIYYAKAGDTITLSFSIDEINAGNEMPIVMVFTDQEMTTTKVSDGIYTATMQIEDDDEKESQTIIVTFTDTAGNVGETVYDFTDTVVIDTIAPLSEKPLSGVILDAMITPGDITEGILNIGVGVVSSVRVGALIENNGMIPAGHDIAIHRIRSRQQRLTFYRSSDNDLYPKTFLNFLGEVPNKSFYLVTNIGAYEARLNSSAINSSAVSFPVDNDNTVIKDIKTNRTPFRLLIADRKQDVNLGSQSNIVFASSNQNSFYAKEGDMITLSLSGEKLSVDPTAHIAGEIVTLTTDDTAFPYSYTGVYTVPSGVNMTLIPYNIGLLTDLAGNTFNPDSVISFITIDTNPPTPESNPLEGVVLSARITPSTSGENILDGATAGEVTSVKIGTLIEGNGMVPTNEPEIAINDIEFLTHSMRVMFSRFTDSAYPQSFSNYRDDNSSKSFYIHTDIGTHELSIGNASASDSVLRFNVSDWSVFSEILANRTSFRLLIADNNQEIIAPYDDYSMITLNNQIPSYVKEGDTLVISFSSEKLNKNSSVLIAGKTLTLATSDTSFPYTYAAAYTIPADAEESTISYDINPLKDGAGNIFDPPVVETSITIDNTPPTLTETVPIGTTPDTTPEFTFTSDEEGTITYAGSCTSSDTAAIAGTNVITFDTLSEGTHSDCTVIVTDTVGNSSTALQISTFTIKAFTITITDDDYTVPEQTKEITANTSYDTDVSNLFWEITENENLCNTVTYPSENTWSVSVDSVDVTLSSEDNNTKKVCFTATYNGFAHYAESEQVGGIDTMAPVIQVTGPAAGTAATKTVTATITDTNADTDSYRYRQTATVACDSTVIADNTEGSPYTGETLTFSTENNNSTYICFRAKDHAGNVSFTRSEEITGIDTTPPTLSTVIFTSDNTNSAYAKEGDTITISLIVSEELAETPALTIQATAVTLTAQNSLTYTGTFTVTTETTNGSITYDLATLTDLAGLTTDPDEATDNTITIDTTAPTLTNPSSIGTTINTTPEFTFTSDEEGTITYAGSCTSSDTAAIAGTNVITFDTLSEGTHSDCTVIVTDTVGNSSTALQISTFTIKAFTITITDDDYTVPEQTKEITANTSYDTDVSNLFWEITENENLCNTVTYPSENTWSVSVDSVDVTLSSEDNNTKKVCFTATYNGFAHYAESEQVGGIDTTPPTLSTVIFTSDNTNSAYAKEGDTITISLIVSEELAEAPTLTIQGTTTTLTAQNSLTYTGTFTVTTETTNGSITYDLATLTDLAGLTTDPDEATDNTITIDTTAPTLTNPSSIGTTINTTPEFTFTSDEEGTITYAGSCTSSDTAATTGTNTVTFDALTEGTYSNCTVAVTDTAGNTSTALTVLSFTIDTTAPTLSTVIFTSDNTNTAYAKEGDTITISLIVSEELAEAPTLTIQGTTTTLTAQNSLTYTGTFTVTTETTNGSITYDLATLTDLAGLTTDPDEATDTTITIDTAAPSFSRSSIFWISGDVTRRVAVTGDTLALSFGITEDIAETPSAAIAGQEATVRRTQSSYMATYQVPENAERGIVSYDINPLIDNAGNVFDPPAVETSIRISAADTTPPTLTNPSSIGFTNDTTPDFTFTSSEEGTTAYTGDCSSAQTTAIAGTNTITFNTLTEGSYSNCTVAVTDSANNDSAALTIPSFTIDTTAPVIQLTGPAAGTAATKTVTATMTDTNADPDARRYQQTTTATCDSTIIADNTEGSPYAEQTLTFSAEDDNGTYICFRVQDRAGNTSFAGSEEITDIDTTPPTLTNPSSIGFTNDTTPDFTFTSSEEGTTAYTGDCSSAQTAAIAGTNVITLTVMAEGVYEACGIRVTDSANNDSAALTIPSFTIDTTAPVIQLTGPAAGTAATKTVTATMTDTNKDPDARRYQQTTTATCDSTIIADNTEGSPYAEQTLTFSAEDDNGTYICFRVQDRAGNTSFAGSEEITDIDTTGATLIGQPTATSNNANTAYAKEGDTITLSFTVSETLTTTPSVTIAGQQASVTNTGTTYTVTYTVADGDDTANAPYDIGVLTDTQNNTSDPPEGLTGITIDTVVPTLTNPSSIGTTSDTTPDSTFTSDEVGTITYGGICTSANTTAIAGTNVVTLTTLTEGTYSNCTIAVTDTAGNTSAALTVPSFTIDTTPPTLSTVIFTSDNADPAYAKEGDTITVSLIVSEELAETPTLTIQEETVTLTAQNSLTYTGTFTVTTETTNGSITYDLATLTDRTGLTTDPDEATDTTITIDTTPPTLTNPSNIGTTSDTTPDFSFTSSEEGTITYTGDCTSSDTAAIAGTNTVTFNTLTEGAHSDCTITVTDAAGNTSTALTIPSFTIDTTAPVIQVTGPAAGTATTKTVAATITDTNKDPNARRYQQTTTATCDSTIIADNTEGTQYTEETLTFSAESDNGTFVCFRAQDRAGNTSFAGSEEITGIDTTPPSLTNPSSIGFTNDTTPEFTFTSNEVGTITYTGDCTSSDTAATTANTVTFDALTEGTYGACEIQVTDSAGNTSAALTVPAFTIDTTAPTLTNPSSIGTTINTTPEFTFTSDEEGTITYAGSCTSSDTAATTGTNTVTFDALTEGTYSNCTVAVTDTAGNTSTALTVLSFTIDTTAPTLSTVIFTSDNTNTAYAKEGDTITVSLIVSEELIEVPTLTIQATAVTLTAQNSLTYTTTYTVSSDTTNGSITYDLATLTDLAGLTTDPDEATDNTITIDTTTPTLTNPSSIGTTSDTTPDSTFTSNEVGTITYTGDCTSSDTAATTGANTVTFDALTEGTYGACEIQVTDSAGNTSAALTVPSFTIDTTPPTLSTVIFTSDNADPAYAKEGDTITVSLIVSEELAETPTLTIQEETVTLTAQNSLTYTGTFTVTTETTNGSITYDLATLTDRTGLTTDPDEATDTTITIDTTPPTLTNPSNIGTTSDTTPDFSFTSSEEGTITYTGDCTSSDTAAIAGTNTVTFNTLTEGAHSDCTITVTDAAGNTSTALTIPSFTIDTTAPVIQVTGPAAGTATTKTVAATITDTNKDPNARRYQQTTTATCDSTIIADNTEGTQYTEETLTFSAESDNGTFVCFRAQDRAGNTSFAGSEEITGIDTTPPSLTNPSSIGFTNDTTPEFTFTSNEVGTITYTGDCTSSDTAAIAGTNTVTFNTLTEGAHSDCTITVTDAAGNTSTALTIPSFTIDTTAPTLTNPSSIGFTNDTTPEFTFTSSETGTITYTGDCTSSDTAASAGTNTITFDALTEGTYSNCTITVTDAAGNTSTTLTVPAFTIDTTTPTLTNPSSIGTTSDTTPEFSFTSSEVGTIAYTGDCTSTDTAAIAGTNTITFDALTEGTYSNCTVAVTDSADNDSAALTIPSFTIDTTAPVIQVTGPAAGTATTKAVAATITDTNEDPNARRYQQTTTTTCDSTIIADNTEGTQYTEETLTFSAESDNGTYVCFRAQDRAGNTSFAGSGEITGIDTTPPTLTNPSNIGTTSDITPDFTFTSSEVGAVTYTGSCTASDTAARAGTNTVTFNTLTEGSYSNCTVTVTDTAGNTSAALTVPTFTIDTTAPSLTNPSNIGTTSDITPDFTFTSSETGTITYTGDCTSSDTAASAGTNTITFDALTEGTYSNCTVAVTDTAGNTSTALTVLSFTIDTTAPSFIGSPTFTSDNADPAYAKEGDLLTLSFTLSEQVQTLPGVTIAGQQASVTQNNNIYTATYTVTDTTQQGTVSVQFDPVQDSAGNFFLPPSPETVVTIDTVEPSLNEQPILTSSNTNTAYAVPEDVLTLSFTLSEQVQTLPGVTIAGQQASVTQNNNIYTATYTVTDTTSQTAVSYTIGALTDRAGNSSEPIEVSTDITIDTTPPTLSTIIFTSDNTNTAYAKEGDTITLSLTVSEELAEAPTLTIQATAVTLTAQNSLTYTTTYTVSSETTNGSITYDLATLTDRAGLTTDPDEATDNTITIDTTAPVIQLTGPAAGTAATKTVTATMTDTNADPDARRYQQTTTATCDSTIIADNTEGSPYAEQTLTFSAEDDNGTYICFRAQDRAGNTSFAGSGEIAGIDTTGATLVGQPTTTSDNTNTAYAKEGDTITLSFTVSETLTTTPSVTIAGQQASVTQNNNTYTATYTVADGDDTANAPYDIGVLTDTQNNTSDPPEGLTGITIDTTAPSFIGSPTFTSDNADPAYAKEGDLLTLSFTLSEQVQTLPGVTIAGQQASVTQNGNTYTAMYFVQNSDNVQNVSYDIGTITDLAGNIFDPPTQETTVTVDTTLPAIVGTPELHIQNNPDRKVATTGDILRLTFTVTEELAQIPPVTIANRSTTVSNVGNDYTATYEVTETTMQGTVFYLISYLQDGAGNISTLTSQQSTITIDTTMPTLTNPSSIGFTNDTTPEFTFTSNEVGTITYTGDCTSSDTAVSAGANTVTFDALTEGTYSNCTITVTDAAGNTSTTLTVPAFTIDTTAPVIQITGPAAGTAATKTVTATITDTNADQDSYRYQQTTTATCDSTIIADNTEGTQYTEGTLTFSAESDNRTYVCFRAQDRAGNVSFAGSGEITGIDTTPPALTNPSSIGFTNDTTPDFTFTSNEVGTITYTGDCTSSDTAVSAGANTVTFDALTEGTYEACGIQVTDSVNNTSAALTVPAFTIDTTAPTLTNPSNIGFTNDTTPEFSFTSSEVGTITYTGSCAASDTAVSAGANTVTFDALTEGTYEACGIQVTDSANNTSAALTVPSFTIDTTAPTLSTIIFTSDNTNTAYAKEGDTITVSLIVSEELAETPALTIQATAVTLTAQNSLTYTTTYTVSSETTNGSITYDLATLTDRAGLTTDPDEATDTTITIDTTAPVIQVTGPAAGTATTKTVTATITDTNKDPDARRYQQTTTATCDSTIIADNTEETQYTEGTLTFSAESDNRTYVCFRAQDRAGNTSFAGSGEITGIDTTPPTLSTIIFTSDNTNTAYAKEGDTITLSLTVSEELIEVPTLTIQATAVTLTAQNSLTYTTTYTVSSETTNGSITYDLATLTDRAGLTTDPDEATDTTITIDTTAPSFIGSPTFTSDNADPAYAKEGDLLTLSFTLSEQVQTLPGVTIAGQQASVTQNGNTYTAMYFVQNSDNVQNVSYDIGTITDLAGNIFDPPTQETTVTVDTTSPTLTNPSNIGTTSNTTPDFTFTSSETGTITYTGDCTSTDTAAIAGTNTITLNTLTERTYSNCTVAVTDSADNDSAALTIPAFTIDTTAPTLTNPSSIGFTNDTTPDFTFTSSEEGTITYTGSCTASDTAARAGTNTVTFDTLTEGTYEACGIQVTDSANNTSAALTIPSFTIDTTAPVIQVTGPAAGTATTKTVTATITDTNKDPDARRYQQTTTATCDSTIIADNTEGTQYTGETLTFSAESDNGTYVCFRAQDRAGNTSFAGSGEITGIDTTPPTLTNPSSIGFTNDTTPEFTFTSNEVGTITYTGDCTSTDTAATAGANTVTFDALTEGTYGACEIQVTDSANNTSAALTIPSFTIDTTSPTLTNPSSIGFTNDTTPDFTFTSDEVGTITYTGDCTSTDTAVSSGTNTVTFDALAEGVHSNCTVAVTDSANNISTALAVPSFTIDTTAPILSSPSNIGTTSDTTPVFTFTSSEIGTITYTGSCTSSDTTAIAGTNTITFDVLAEGTYNNCAITVTDSAENTSTTLAVPSFTIDTTAPILSSPSSIGFTSDTTPDFTFTSSEIGAITYGGDCSSAQTTAVAGTNTVTFDALAEGTHSNCTIAVTDSANNVSAALTVPSFTVDTTSPTLSSPSSIGFTNNTTPDFTFTSDEVGTITYTGDCTSSDAAAIAGTNTVTFDTLTEGTYGACEIQVTDSANNASDQLTIPSFTVDTTAPSLSETPILQVLGSPSSQVAVSGDTLTLTFTVTEGLAQTPSVTIAGQEATITGANNDYTARYQVTDTTGEGVVSYNIGPLTDSIGNTFDPPQGTTGITIDTMAAMLTDHSVTTSNADTMYAKEGDTITVAFTTSETLSEMPQVTIAGQQASVTNVGAAYTAQYVVPAGENTENITYDIGVLTDDGGHTLDPPPQTTGITIDTMVPTITELSFVSSNANPMYAREGDTITTFLAVSEPLTQPPTIAIQGSPITLTAQDSNTYTSVYTVRQHDVNGHVFYNIEPLADHAGNTLDPPQTVMPITIDTVSPPMGTPGEPDTSKKKAVTLTLKVPNNQFQISTSIPEEEDNFMLGGDCEELTENMDVTMTVTPDESTLMYTAAISSISGTYENCTTYLMDDAGNKSGEMKYDKFTVRKGGVGMPLDMSTFSSSAPNIDFDNTSRRAPRSEDPAPPAPVFIPEESDESDDDAGANTESYSFTRNLTIGSTGEDVRQLQIFLNANGYIIAAAGPGSPGNESTYFGELTRQALARYQAANGITPAVGYFGAITREYIQRTTGSAS